MLRFRQTTSWIDALTGQQPLLQRLTGESVHIVVQSARYFDPPERRRKGAWNQYIFSYADEKRVESEMRELGNPCPARHILSTLAEASLHEEEIVDSALFTAGGFALVGMQLLIAQGLDCLALPPYLLKDFYLLVAQFGETQ